MAGITFSQKKKIVQFQNSEYKTKILELTPRAVVFTGCKDRAAVRINALLIVRIQLQLLIRSVQRTVVIKDVTNTAG